LQHMEAGKTNSQGNQLFDIDPSRLEQGFNDANHDPEEQLVYHNTSSFDTSTVQPTFQRRTATLDGEGEGITNLAPGSYPGEHVANGAPPQQEHHRSQPIWSKVADWVKGAEQDQSLQSSTIRPSTTFYTQVEGDSSQNQEKSSGSNYVPKRTQEGDDDETGQSQIYTRTAAETVHTFLSQNGPSTYSMGAK
jgi:hypothetical protein